MEVHEGTGPVRITRDQISTKIECWRPMEDGVGFDFLAFGQVDLRLATQVVSFPLAKWKIETDGEYVTFNVGVALHPDGQVFDPHA